MIKQLKVQRFKCFKSQRLGFSNLTLLAGANGSGKSSVIQVLLLIRQAFYQDRFQSSRFPLNGSLVNIGTVGDARFSRSSIDSIEFDITGRNKRKEFTGVFSYEKGGSGQYFLNGKPRRVISSSSLFNNPFSYLHAERIGPKLTYPVSDALADTTTIGIHGEYAFDWLAKHDLETLPNIAMAFPNETSFQLGYQARLWMRSIVPSLDWNLFRIGEADVVRLELGNSASGYTRPTNTGFGISYVLPVVIAALISKPNTCLIIENPESHLHPAAQSAIGQFLARTAATGVQVIIETHSDHVLNGIRLAVKDGVLLPSSVKVLFFQKNPDNVVSEVQELKVTSDGRIPSWPPGFFDQTEKDLLALL